MSMNLYVEATLPCTVKINGKRKRKVLREAFDLFQTPTDVTRAILKAEDRFEAYKKWCQMLYFGDIHIHDLKKWLEDHDGWEIYWYEL